ncbi:two-component sensor histidine kinase [Pseudoclavibacter endophyticus]|uniref:histidine kinase n=2 Tax=Pseudoclavibacter endophyticus TaxID=1778590 RepID=A0A6H9WHS2_9MICO|nr:HAMP domain-containing histidine kinase [Pseudoclavibacter endophyticus]GGA61994.1 two-component sensor histidine kinase [Pseudoclavibacter endophyticus]
MLEPVEIAIIVLTTVVCTAAVMGVALLALRLNRRGSIASQLTVVVAAAIVAIAASTVAVVLEMFFSEHDLTVFVWVIGVSAVVSLAASWLVIRVLARRSAETLKRTAERIGDGAVVDDPRPGWREFDEVSAQLADASERLAAARDEITRLDESRRQFFAWISHDLRTPLAGIRATTEALEDGMTDDPAASLRRIRSKVDTMNRMVDDLFQLSKLESGTLELHREPVVLLDLISDAVVDVADFARMRGISIRRTGLEGHLLWADPRELTRAIGNLLVNGVRHAPNNSEIVVSAATLDDDRLVLSIFDHGSGVASEDLGRMFDVGWRGSAARSAEGERAVEVPGAQDGQGTGDGRGGGHGFVATAGAGLGLAIVRGIIEAHDGEVVAENLVGGFRLSVVLPTGQACASS